MEQMRDSQSQRPGSKYELGRVELANNSQERTGDIAARAMDDEDAEMSSGLWRNDPRPLSSQPLGR